MDAKRLTDAPLTSVLGGQSLAVYSIGHSNHATESFLSLLRQHRIEILCDVRSHPASAYAHQFNEPQLRTSLEAAGLRYIFLGHQLGGRPVGDDYYDDEGYVRYDQVAKSAEFMAGIKRLEREAASHDVAMMCSEENPAGCHRRLLVARVLATRGIEVRHIRAIGRIQSEDEVAAEHLQKELGNQRSLFDITDLDISEAGPWRSLRSVLPKRRQPTFSSG